MTEKTTMRKDLGGKEIRDKLKGKSGQAYWSSLESISKTEEFAELISREFPEQADQLSDSQS